MRHRPTVVARGGVPWLRACDAHLPALLGRLRLRPELAASRAVPLGLTGALLRIRRPEPLMTPSETGLRRAPGGEHLLALSDSQACSCLRCDPPDAEAMSSAVLRIASRDERRPSSTGIVPSGGRRFPSGGSVSASRTTWWVMRPRSSAAPSLSSRAHRRRRSVRAIRQTHAGITPSAGRSPSGHCGIGCPVLNAKSGWLRKLLPPEAPPAMNAISPGGQKHVCSLGTRPTSTSRPPSQSSATRSSTVAASHHRRRNSMNTGSRRPSSWTYVAAFAVAGRRHPNR